MKPEIRLKMEIAKAIEHAYQQNLEPAVISSILSEAVVIALPTNVRKAHIQGEMRKGERLWRYKFYACEVEDTTDG